MEEVKITSQDDIFELIFNKDDLSWQTIIQELVRTNQMNPWDIDVSVLTQKYLAMLKKLKELDFRVSGKVVLAAAILLKIKSSKLVGADMQYLDSLFAQRDESDEYYDGMDAEFGDDSPSLVRSEEDMKLVPRTPQARRRKVSIYDLMNALQKAMEVKRRRVMRDLPPLEMKPPEKTKDITLIIKEIYGRIKTFFTNNSKLTFSQLVPSGTRKDKVSTFIPLLHLANSRKIGLFQEQHFGEIEIQLRNKNEINKELGVA